MGIFGLPALGIGDALAVLSNPYGLPDNQVWNLQKGSFRNAQGKTVIFFYDSRKGQDITMLTAVDQISDGGGRRLAVYEYPYLDGQAVDDLGRKGEKYTFNIKFHGQNYQVLLKEFLDVVISSNGPGTLNHPVRGVIQCRFLDYEMIHRYDEFNAVTIRATFLEDNTGAIQTQNLQPASSNSILRSVLGTAISAFATANETLFAATALLNSTQQTKQLLALRLQSISDSVLLFLGKLAATFSSDAKIQALYANAQSALGGFSSLNSGTTQSGTKLPPVYQVGFTTSQQTSISSTMSSFLSGNQISTQQALYQANKIRSSLSVGISELELYLGIYAFETSLIYRQLAVSIQTVTESCIASSQSQVVVYTTPRDMSVRQIAFENNLSVDRQNDIDALNPFLTSINFVPQGTTLLVPSS